jgi:hypothetical protein
MKKGLCVSIFSFVLVFWVCSFTVFGLVEYEEKFVLTEETKVSDMISSMMYQLNPITTTDTLEYTIKLKLSTNIDRREFISSLQSQIIERLDAVCTITPSVKTSLYSDKVIFSVIKYVPTNNAYYNKLNTLVSEGSKLKTDVEKIYYLSNYFYNNGFKYAYDNEVEFGHIKSSSTYQNLNAMPDSVLERKKAICMGFANVGSEYLTALGIDEERLIKEDKSTDTIENIKNSFEYITINSKIAVLSSQYHVFRAKLICKRLGLDVVGIGCYAPVTLYPNQLLFEKLGLIKMLIKT